MVILVNFLHGSDLDDANKTLMARRDSILRDHNVAFPGMVERLGVAPVHLYKQNQPGIGGLKERGYECGRKYLLDSIF